MEKPKPVHKMDQMFKDQILDQLPAPIMAVDKDLKILYMNDSALDMVGQKLDDIKGKYCRDIVRTADCGTDACSMKKAMATGEKYSNRTEAQVGGNTITAEYYAVPLKDDKGQVIGGVEFILDITKQVQYEKNLIEQSRTIQKLSTPTIKMWDGILVLPIIGVIDSMRAQSMMETMLNRISETYSRVVILDIHGVAAVDTAVAQHLIKIARATKLMGCDCILSGISPAVAQTIIHLGIEMDSVKTKATLSDAFAEALEILSLQVTEKKQR